MTPSIFADKLVSDLFTTQLQELPAEVYTLQTTRDCLLLHLNLSECRKMETSEEACLAKKRQTGRLLITPNRFVIKVGKCFPLSSVRLHLYDGPYMPRISDGRDLLSIALGKDYSYKVKLVEIVKAVPRLESLLIHRNDNYLQMQKTGIFRLGECFSSEELAAYSSLTLFTNKADKRVVALTDTHLITFKEKVEKKKHKMQHSSSLNEAYPTRSLKNIDEDIPEQLILIESCSLQCIDSLVFNKEGHQIKLTLKRYKAVKLYFEAQNVSKLLRLGDCELFIRGVLKHISKFQPMEMRLRPGKIKGSQVESMRVAEKIAECTGLQQQVKACREDERKGKLLSGLNNLYQQLIQYYSSRANPYYLIYVSKLNAMHMEYYAACKQSI